MAYITLNKKHFFNNLDIITNRTKSKDKIAIVLKDNAYGHGLLDIATMAKEYGISKAIVRTCKEAEEIGGLFEYVLVLCEIPAVTRKGVRYAINDIKSIEKLSHIPVIAVSAGAMKENINQAMQADFADYITKPVDVQELIKSIESIDI